MRTPLKIWKRLGRSIGKNIILVVYTLRRFKNGKETIRIISARPAVAKNAKVILDKDIDFSDIPESTDAELKGAKRVGRPSTGRAKQLIALRVNPALLAKIRKMAEQAGKPYQTYIHDILEKLTKKGA
jgi:predicted DNA binding CopG/RHH family protein